jgi:hypothetical protein
VSGEEPFFDVSFLRELEDLAAQPGPAGATVPGADLSELMRGFLAPTAVEPQGLTLEGFIGLSPQQVAERTNALVELCRSAAGQSEAARAVESFIIFFQALLPTLSTDGARQVRTLFFRLVPTLVQIAHFNFGDDRVRRLEGKGALQALETVLLEIASVRFSPGESELVFRSIDQMAAFIAIGEYAVATDLISSQLLSVVRRNKIARVLYRLMETEVSVQNYLRERLGRRTPWVVLPGDEERLADYGPIRIFHDELLGERRRLIQIQVPGISDLRNIVLHLSSTEGRGEHDLALDGLGAAPLDVPEGSYSLGLSYSPPDI